MDQLKLSFFGEPHLVPGSLDREIKEAGFFPDSDIDDSEVFNENEAESLFERASRKFRVFYRDDQDKGIFSHQGENRAVNALFPGVDESKFGHLRCKD